MNGLGQRISLLVAALLVLVAPLPFGGRGRTAMAVLALVAVVGGLALLAARSRLPAPPTRLAVLALALLALPLIQLVPLPAPAVEILSPRLAEECRASLAFPEAPPELVRAEAALAEAAGGQRPVERFRPLSTDPEGTLDGMLRLGLGVLAFLLALLAVRDRGDRRLIVAALALSAVLQAVYGLAELLSGHEHILGEPKVHHLGVATGTFVNPNHYGALLSLGLFAVLALLHDLWRQRETRDPGRGPKASLAASAAAVIVIALIWSASRGALFCAAGGLALWGLLSLGSLASGQARRVAAGLLGALILVLVAGAIWMRPPEPLIDSLEGSGLTLGNRLTMWGDGLDMLAAFPVLGTGLGTYGTVADLFRSPDLRFRTVHAHSDYLEWAVEGGAPGVLLVIAFLVITGSAALGLLRRRRERALSVALAAGLAALAVHEAVDFSLQLAGVAVPAAVALGAMLAPWARRETQGPRPRKRATWALTLAVATALGGLTAGGLLVASRTPSPALSKPPGGLVLPSTLRRWGSTRAVEVIERAAGSGRTTPAPTDSLTDALSAPLLSLQRSARRAPLRPEPRVALWSATQAFVAAHPRRDELGSRVAPLLAHYLRRAEQLAPSDRERRLVIARYWLAVGQRQEAIRVLRELLAMAPERARDAYALLGGASAPLHELLQATPNEPDAALNLSSHLWRHGDRVGAQIVLERALTRAPDQWPLRAALARRLMSREQPERALAVLEGRPLPGEPEERKRALQLRAESLARQGRLTELDETLADLEQLGASTAELDLARGRAAARVGENDAAIAALERALDATRPSLSERQRLQALLVLGSVYQRTGNYPEALAQYRRARDIDAGHPAVTRFFDQLSERRGEPAGSN